MKLGPPSPEEQVRFLENFQTLLSEGQFTSTSKFALLVALADIAVETPVDGGTPLEIPVRRIAEKFVAYYWDQVAPWASAGRGSAVGILTQNTGQPATILKRVHEVRESVSPYRIDVRRDPEAWRALLASVGHVVKAMPLWKLQRVPGRTLDFLYENVGRGNSVTLKPGVAFHLRRFHPLIVGMARAAWADFVRKLRANRQLLGQATDLHSFLFGTERTDLKDFRPLLRDLQEGVCFYCAKSLGRDSAVDHLVPWSRYPVDLAHNFVLADARAFEDEGLGPGRAGSGALWGIPGRPAGGRPARGQWRLPGDDGGRAGQRGAGHADPRS